MMTDDQIDALIESTKAVLEKKQAAIDSEFGLGARDEWKADLTTPKIDFIDNGNPVVTADLVIVGSLAKGVWLWGWANQKLPEAVRQTSEEMKLFADMTGLNVFVEPAWEGGDDEAWMISALACNHFDGDGVYRMPSKKSDIYAVLRNVRCVA